MIIKRKPFSELWPNACSCVGFTMCAFGQVTLCTVYTLHVCPLVVICLPLGLLKFFLFINSDLLQLTCRNSSPNPASQLLTAVKDFQKGMEPYLAAFEGHSKYYLFRFTLGTSKEQSYTTNHLVHVVGLGKPKMLVVCVLSVCCYHYLLVLAIHLCVSIHVYICCSRTVFVL